MDAVEFVKEKRRICEAHQSCTGCPLGIFTDCGREVTEELVKAVEEWSEEHPVMTNWEKFEEVFGRDMSWLTTIPPNEWIPIVSMPTFILSRDWWIAEYKEDE